MVNEESPQTQPTSTQEQTKESKTGKLLFLRNTRDHSDRSGLRSSTRSFIEHYGN